MEVSMFLPKIGAGYIRSRMIVVLVFFAFLRNGVGEDAQKRSPVQLETKPLVAHVTWTGKDGAPGNVTALGQTSDGYLWIGTSLGLYRFDGVQFSNYHGTARR